MTAIRLTVILLLIMTALPIHASANSKPAPIQVHMDGAPIPFEEAEPWMENGITYVPFRPLFESMGLQVDWNSTTKTVTGSRDGMAIQVSLNQGTATINGQPHPLEAKPRLVKGVTYVPLRFIAEATGKTVEWNGKTRTVTITTPSLDRVIEQRLAQLGISNQGTFRITMNDGEDPISIVFEFHRNRIGSLSNAGEVRQTVSRIMRQIEEIPGLLYQLTPPVRSFQLQVIYEGTKIYEWDFVKSDNESDPRTFDKDSDMRVSIDRDRGVVLHYKVKGTWGELPVLGPHLLTEDEKGVLEFYTRYMEALNKGDAAAYMELIRSDLRHSSLLQQVKDDLTALNSTWKPIAVEVLEFDPRRKHTIIRSIEEVHPNGSEDMFERSMYMLLVQLPDQTWVMESIEADSIEYTSVIAKLGSYDIAKHAPYHKLYPNVSISAQNQQQVSSLIADLLQAMNEKNMAKMMVTAHPDSRTYEQWLLQQETYVKQQRPKVTLSWGPEDNQYLRLQDNVLYTAVQLHYGFDQANAAEHSYTKNIIIAMKQDQQGSWKVIDVYTTKIHYSFQWLSWTLQ
jgi:hypothetical protein